jgi:hypothetical protein
MKVLANRIWVVAVAALLLALGACSSSDSNDNDKDDTPPPVQTTGVLSVGVITGFGSVYVDGVRYDSSSASVTMDDSSATEAQLRVGQYVEVKGHAHGDDHHADIIRYHNVLEGPITSIDVDASSFVAMGQTILVSSDTSLGDDIQPSSILGLAEGDVVEVSGVVPLSGPIDATRVDIKPDGGPYEVTGYVADLDSGVHLFLINDLVVDYSGANMEDFPSGAPAEGDLVLVKGSTFAPFGEFLATEVELRSDDYLKPAPGDVVEVEGEISDFVLATDFYVAGMHVTTTATTIYEHGTVGDLANDVEVRVKGVVDAANLLVAHKIAFEVENTVRIVAQVQATDPYGGVTLLGFEVATDEFTRYEDDSALELREFDFGDIAVGDWLDVRAYEEPEGSNDVVATRIERIDAEEQVRLRGPFRNPASPNFDILSILVTTSDSTVFRLENVEPPGDRLTRDQFFYLAGGEIVEAWGDWTGTALAAQRVEIKVRDD